MRREMLFVLAGTGRGVSKQNGGSAECERESLDARPQELDLELAFPDGSRLPDDLVEALFGHRTVALLVDVVSVRRAWRLSVDPHAECYGCSRFRRTHDEMNISSMEAVGDDPA